MKPFLHSSRLARFSLVALVSSAASLSACSGADPGSDDDSTPADGEFGRVGLELTAGGVTLNAIDYAITKGSYSKTGSIDVTNSTTISAVIGGIPAGTGYTITLSGNDAADPTVACNASGTFDVTARATANVVLKLLCRLAPKTGSVKVNGTLNVCPRIDALSVSPGEATVGGTIALASQITDDALPAAATYSYATTGGTLAGATTPNATLTCTAAGDFTVTLAVSDGDCSDTVTATVKCTATSAPPPPANIKVNEVESSGGTPGDWTELYNAGTTATDISGWVFKDNDDTHAYVIPAGTTIAAGGYYVVEEAAQTFGLGAADSTRLYDKNGALVDSYSWTAHALTTYGRCPNGTGNFTTTTSSTKGAANDCSVAVKVNEVESNGGTPGDWTELYNAGAVPADLSGFVFKDNDDTHNYVLPAGTVIAPGGYYVIEEAAQTFGLGAADSVRLFDPSGKVVDSYTWTAHATTTYARCPNGTGPFGTSVADTKGAANNCAPVGPVLSVWPGTDDVVAVDAPEQFTSNLSGLTYEAATASSPAVLWGVVNGPGTLFRLLWNGTIWTPDTANGWSAGKALHYPNGTGNPDSEGVSYGASVADGIYVATERNNDASTVSKLSVLRFDVSATGTSLNATHEWDLTAALPATGANLGLEAISYIPDSFLVANGFFDEAAGHAYNPAEYPAHGTGLFVVGVEGTGMLHVFALNHASGTATKLASFVSGTPGVMDTAFDRDLGYLWATCDDTCGNQAGILAIDKTAGSPTLGRFVVRRQFSRPTTLPETNNEGFTFAPVSECVNGQRSVFWSDDNDLATHSLREGSLQCASLL